MSTCDRVSRFSAEVGRVATYVSNDSERDQENRRVDIHVCQTGDDGRSSKQQLGADEDIRDQGEEDEDQMSQLPISDMDDLQIGVAPRSIHLRLASKNREHKDLNRGACRVPERTCNAVGVCHSATLQKRGSPSPG